MPRLLGGGAWETKSILKARSERKKREKEAAATGVRNPISLALAAKAFLMRRKSPRRKGNA
jgi:hypothetical protein